MSPSNATVRHLLPYVAAVALVASSVAFADDNSMSMWTGDSYAFFNDLDYSPGRFNVARGPQPDPGHAVATAPAPAKMEARRPILLATEPTGRRRTNPFRDDTAG